MNLLRIEDIAERKFRVSLAHAYNLVREPGFPSFVMVPGRGGKEEGKGRKYVRRWPETEVDAYIASLPRAGSQTEPAARAS